MVDVFIVRLKNRDHFTMMSKMDKADFWDGIRQYSKKLIFDTKEEALRISKYLAERTWLDWEVCSVFESNYWEQQ